MHSTRLATALLISALVLGALSGSAEANDLLKGKRYHFGTHPARTNITFISEADLETIHGITHKIRGSLGVDATGKSAAGTLRVGVGALRTGIDLRDQHLRSSDWLDAARHPFIQLQVVRATESKDPRFWDYTANLTIKGVTKEIKGKARITAFPDHIGKPLGAGSWMRVRANFDVTLSDFGIRIPQQVGPKVSKTWKVGVDIYGTSAAPKGR